MSIQMNAGTRTPGRSWKVAVVRMVLLAIGLAASNGHASADIILSYDGSNSETTLSPTQATAGLVPIDLVRGEGLNDGSGNTFNSSGWNDEATDYLEWGWSSSPAFDLTKLDLRYDRSNSGPSMVDIQLAINGGGFQSIFTDQDVSASGEDVLDVDLSSFTGVTSATFRLFGTGASSGGGTFDIEPLSGVSPTTGIRVQGIAAVPEPSSFYLLGVALAGLLLVRRYRC